MHTCTWIVVVFSALVHTSAAFRKKRQQRQKLLAAIETNATGAVQEESSISSGWDSRRMKMTHYWDCSGQACDSATLQPFVRSKYISPPGYGPQDPKKFGGAVHGEKMWLTGAASDALSKLMGADSPGCGKDGNRGGCGKCLLIQNPDAVKSSWTAVVMKKNRCPPESNGCADNKPHFDVAIPGFDDLQYSKANICGRSGTGFTNQKQSEALGKWYQSCSNTAQCAHKCDQLPSSFRAGCKLFASWGWKSGDPSRIKFRAVKCPLEFVRHVRGTFGKNGPISTRRRRTTTTPRRRRTTTTRRRRTTTTRRRRSTTPRRRRSSSRGGCCRFGADCGDCGTDGSGWCHKSASNCGQCTGKFDPSGRAPTCR